MIVPAMSENKDKQEPERHEVDLSKIYIGKQAALESEQSLFDYEPKYKEIINILGLSND